MTDQEALEIYKAGQALLDALHPHYDDKGLDNFDRQLGAFYELASLDHALCRTCDADCPRQLLTSGVCVTCLD